MAKTPFTLLIYFVGASTIWALNGFKGKVTDYLPGPYEQSKKRTKVFIAGVAVIFPLGIILYRIAENRSSSDNTKSYQLTPEQTKKVIEGIQKMQTAEIDSNKILFPKGPRTPKKETE